MPARKCVCQLSSVRCSVWFRWLVGRLVGRLVCYKCMKSLLNVYLSVSNRVFSISFVLSSWRLFRTQQTHSTWLFYSVHYFFFIALTFFGRMLMCVCVCALSLNWFDIVIFHRMLLFDLSYGGAAMLSSIGNSSSRKFEFLWVLFVCAAAATAADQIGLRKIIRFIESTLSNSELNQVNALAWIKCTTKNILD